MILHIARGETYIPKWNGNDADDKPITFHLHYLTPDEREQVQGYFVSSKATKKGVTVKTDMKEAFMLGVEKIDNLSIVIDGEEKVIDTAAKFMQYAMPEGLYIEVSNRVKETTGVNVPS
jgi:hypothetical protein